MNSDIFKHEIDIAKKSSEIVHDYNTTNDPLSTEYKILSREYQVLLKTLKK